MSDLDQRRRVRPHLLLLAALPSVAMTLSSWWFGFRLNLFEAGTLVAGGSQMLDGKAPYTEIFAFYGPLSYLEPGLLGRIGPGLIGLQVGALIVSALVAVVAYWISARISNSPHLALVVPVLLAMGGNLSDRTLLPLIAVALLCRWEERRSRLSLFGAGAFTALSILYLQDSGAALAAAIVATFIVGRALDRGPREVLTWSALGVGALGAASVLVPFGIWLAVKGSLTAWFYYCFVYPNVTYTKRSAGGYITDLVSGWAGERPLELGYHVVFYLLPYVTVVVAALVCAVLAWIEALRSPRAAVFARVSMAVLGTFGVLQLRTLFASIDEAKLAAAAAPVLAMCLGYALRTLVRQRVRTTAPFRGGHRWLVVGAALTCAWFALWSSQDFVHDMLGRERLTTSDPARGPMVGFGVVGGISPASSLAELEAVSAVIGRRTTSADPIFIAPNSPYLYYLARRENVTAQPLYTNESAEVYAPVTYARIRELYVEAERIGPFSVMALRE
jgi:hypothetical protein